MSESAASLRGVFSLPEKGTKDSSPDRWKTFQTTVSREVKTIKWPAAMPDVAEKICELFDVKLPDLFLISWGKMDELRRLLAESKKTPEIGKSLELADHTIRSEHRPYIDVKIKNVPVKKIQFSVKLQMKLKGFVLTIQAGEIVEILTGRCEVEGTVEYAGLTIAEKKLSPINLPALCSFKSEAMPTVYQRTAATSHVAAVSAKSADQYRTR
ncbi:MAG: hypothetical protein ABR555_10015 [Pyrinomonadaceae bacterium]